MSINLLHHAPAVSCTPKQIDLQAFLLRQLPYCVRVLLLTSGCKLAAAHTMGDTIFTGL